MQSNIKSRMANSVFPDEMAHYEPSHLDLHCLEKYMFWSYRVERGNKSTVECMYITSIIDCKIVFSELPFF